jgi:hypothetical protein
LIAINLANRRHQKEKEKENYSPNRGSNSGPLAYKASARTTELSGRDEEGSVFGYSKM